MLLPSTADGYQEVSIPSKTRTALIQTSVESSQVHASPLWVCYMHITDEFERLDRGSFAI
jgi:hypothetical protein